MATKLAFRTKAGGEPIPAGLSKKLGVVEVGQFNKIRVVTDDRRGVLAAISLCISEAGMNITHANCRAIGDGKALNDFEMPISDLRQLREVIWA